MNLAKILRGGVAIANRVTGGAGGTQGTVLHSSAQAEGGTHGEPVYLAAVERACVIEEQTQLYKMPDGEETMEVAKLTFLVPVSPSPKPHDKFVLPSGVTGWVLAVTGVLDPGTSAPYAAEVILGASDRRRVG